MTTDPQTEMSWHFDLPAPYDFGHCVAAARFLYTAARPMPDGALRRLLRVGDRLALFEFTALGHVDQPRIAARLLTADGALDPALADAKLRAFLNPHADITRFYETITDPPLRAATHRLRGLHAFGADTFFEALALTMIEQQITLKMAQNGERWLMTAYGGQLVYEGETYMTFPTAAHMAALTVDEIAPMKITRVRLARIIALAQQITTDEVPLEALRTQSPEAVYAVLRTIKGVGHWTAAWTLIRALGHYPYLGNADVALRAAVNHYYYGQPGRIDRALMDEIFARSGEYGGIAAFYILMQWAFERY